MDAQVCVETKNVGSISVMLGVWRKILYRKVRDNLGTRPASGIETKAMDKMEQYVSE